MPDPLDLSQLLENNRNRLYRMVQLRMDRRLQGRVDASDIIQEAYLEATERLPEYERNPKLPPFLWLRFITAQRLLRIHRRHFGVQARDPRKEVGLFAGVPEATSAALAAQLIGHQTSPSQAAIRAEVRMKLQAAINQLREKDREILAMRHSEQLTSREIAVILELTESAARKRYIRALRNLKSIVSGIPDLDILLQ